MGSAMTTPAFDNGHSVHLVGTHLDDHIIDQVKINGYHPTLKRKLPPVTAYHFKEWRTAAQGADLIICGVSSFGVPWFAEHIIPYLEEGTTVLAITKGLLADNDNVITFPEYFSSCCDNAKHLSFLAVGGPCTSYEFAQRLNTFVSFCGEDQQALKKAKDLLSTWYYHISLSNDVKGIECAVALKNAYAFGVTLAVGMTKTQLGSQGGERYNPQAALFSQAVKEASSLIPLLGGGEDNINVFAGDLYVTIFGGRTRLLGTLLGEGFTFDEAMKHLEGITLESVAITGEIAKVLEKLSCNDKNCLEAYPLMNHVNDLIYKGKKVDIPWKKFEAEAFH